MVRILLIDDDDDFRSMLRTALEQDGYIVQEARNGHEGSRCYRTAPADLVILDLLMPEQEGLETIQALRQAFPAVKIIAISGGTGRLNFLPLAKIFGALRILQKPFTLQQLQEVMREVLQHQAP
jgi:two-component system response regulator (stage 0 sporulation protein F)